MTARLPFAAILSLLLAFVLGWVAHTLVAGSSTIPLALRKDEDTPVPAVHLRMTPTGTLEGTIDGDARVFWNAEIIAPGANGRLVFPTSLKSIVDVNVPEGMHFVASRKGKNYYPVTSANGEKIAPANRVYFRSAEEAEAGGFLKGK